MGDATDNFLKGQASFYISMVLCILLLPDGLRANEGISYYSAHILTFFPYMIGLLVTAWFSIKAAGQLPKHRNHGVSKWLITLASLGVLVAVIPFAFNSAVETIHTVISGLLFVTELGLIFWLALKVKRDQTNKILLVLSVAAILITLFYLNRVIGYLIVGELTFQFLFGITVLRSLESIAPSSEKS